MKDQFILSYIRLKLEGSTSVNNVYLFSKELGISEKEFYQIYSSLEALEADIFNQLLHKVVKESKSADVWGGYTSREKFLSLCFAWIEALKENRSFVQMLWKMPDPSMQMPKLPAFLNTCKEEAITQFKEIVQEGLSSKEIEDRKFISDKYADALWMNLLFITHFWLKDTSQQFEKTDAAIEKSVNLAYDLMGKSALDSVLDLGKFLFQNR